MCIEIYSERPALEEKPPPYPHRNQHSESEPVEVDQTCEGGQYPQTNITDRPNRAGSMRKLRVRPLNEGPGCLVAAPGPAPEERG